MGAVERMLPALRFFRHEDGSLARFNGMGATIHDRIAAILRHDDTPARRCCTRRIPATSGCRWAAPP